MPVADVIETELMMSKYFLLLGGPVRPEGKAPAAILRPGSGSRDDLPVVVADARKKLSSGLAMVAATLTVGVECRERLRCYPD